MPFDPPIEDHTDGRKRNKSKKKKSKKNKKDKRENRQSSSKRNRAGPDQFQPFEAGSPVSPEEFAQVTKVRNIRF